jgi:hypothetical protein
VEVEFLKLAGVMLAMRYQLINGSSCIDDPSHISKKGEEPLYSQMAYLGYKDTIAEMRLLLAENFARLRETNSIEIPRASLLRTASA